MKNKDKKRGVRRTVTIEIGDDPSWDELYQISMADWQAMPTLATGQADDLKYDGQKYRVWVGRSSLADWCGDAIGYTDSRISFEELINGRWVALDRYGNWR